MNAVANSKGFFGNFVKLPIENLTSASAASRGDPFVNLT